MAKREEMESDFKLEYSKYSYLVNMRTRAIWSPEGTQCHFHSPQDLTMLKGVEAKAKRIDPAWRIETHFYNKPIKV